MIWKIRLLDAPAVIFAHSYATAHYAIDFYVQEDFLELTCQQTGAVQICYADGQQKTVPAGTAHLSLYTQPFRASSTCRDCRHITVGFHVRYQAQRLPQKELLQDCRRESGQPVFYIAEEGLPLREGSLVEAAMQRLIALPETGKTLRCTALLYQLLATLSEETLRTAGGLSAAALLYGRRAAGYIAAHLQEKLTVAGVAAALQVSPGYLAAMFRQYTGQSVLPYIQSLRVTRIQELMLARRLSLMQAAESVGLADANYASRLFRKCTGQTVREWQRANRKDSFEPPPHPQGKD